MNLDQENQNQQTDQTNNQPKENDELHTSDQNDASLKCLAELSMWQDQCKRISAEFENFKRRMDKEKVRWADMAKESMLFELLSFVDTFEVALQQKDGVDHKGIEMVYQSLLKLLAKNDVTVMIVETEFDPEYHEAVMQVASEKHTSGQIVDLLAKGFMLKDRVLRPAKVSVAI